jgi:hypothetical protein
MENSMTFERKIGNGIARIGDVPGFNSTALPELPATSSGLLTVLLELPPVVFFCALVGHTVRSDFWLLVTNRNPGHALGRLSRVLLALASVEAFLATGCSDYTQTEKDRDTLIAFRSFFATTWNENVVGTTTGVVDFVLSNAKSNSDAGSVTCTENGTDGTLDAAPTRCTESGTLHVTGQGQSDGKTYALNYAFNSYSLSAGTTQSIDIESITGEISVNGVIGSSTAFTADGLVVDGSVSNSNEDASGALDSPLGMDCVVTASSGSGSVNDRDPVSWSIGGGGSSSSSSACSQYTIACGTVSNGIEVMGGVVPQTCSCPTGTTNDGVDNVTAGGPYFICTCN